MTQDKLSKENTIPEMVNTDNENGVENIALELAKAFIKSQGNMAKKCTKRGELSHLYLSTQNSWMNEETLNDKTKQRPFKQVLYALSKGMNLLRVYNNGQVLHWRENQHKDYRNNDMIYKSQQYFRYGQKEDYRGGYMPFDHRNEYRDNYRDEYRPNNRYRNQYKDFNGRKQFNTQELRPVICYNFNNTGKCDRGNKCRFREHCQNQN